LPARFLVETLRERLQASLAGVAAPRGGNFGSTATTRRCAWAGNACRAFAFAN